MALLKLGNSPIQNWGIFEAEIGEKCLTKHNFVHNPAPEGMEDLASVVARAGEFLEEIRDLEGNILLSTHAIAMKGLLEYLTPDANGKYWSTYIGNCAVYAAENKDGVIGVPREVI